MYKQIVRAIFNLIGKLFYKVTVIGLENYPKKGGAILISSHNTLIDAFIFAVAQSRILRFVIFKSVFSKPVLGKFLYSLKMIPIASTRNKRAKYLRAK